MKRIIEDNLADSDFTVDTLAYELRVSRTSLYNKVKGLTGNTPSDLIRTYRIGKAKILLRDHHHSVTDVAELVGFTDQKHFREVFKKHFGMTPSDYIKLMKEDKRAIPESSHRSTITKEATADEKES
jgi:AraC-like DNA-binding protein